MDEARRDVDSREGTFRLTAVSTAPESTPQNGPSSGEQTGVLQTDAPQTSASTTSEVKEVSSAQTEGSNAKRKDTLDIMVSLIKPRLFDS